MQLLSALVLSNDTAALRISNKILNEHSFDIKEATNTTTACDLLKRNRFDLAIYDQDTPGSMELTSRAVPGAPKMVFAILSSSKCRTDDKRVHFMLHKPLAAELFSKSLKAAYGVMLREKRAAYRHKVQIHATAATLLHAGQQQKLEDTVIQDLSQTGLNLGAKSALLPQGAMVQLAFELPATQEKINVSGTVVWAHASGRAGIKFVPLPREDRDKLQTWVEMMLALRTGFATRGAA